MERPAVLLMSATISAVLSFGKKGFNALAAPNSMLAPPPLSEVVLLAKRRIRFLLMNSEPCVILFSYSHLRSAQDVARFAVLQ
jgi:hypothetical protein